MPFVFPIVGLFVSGTGISMLIKYIRSDQKTRSRLDQWMTEIVKTAIKTFIRVRYGVDINNFSPSQQDEYWRRFGLHIEAFLRIAEPIAMEMFGRPLGQLTRAEQAAVAERVGRIAGEFTEEPAPA
jgi:hypothetical protein